MYTSWVSHKGSWSCSIIFWYFLRYSTASSVNSALWQHMAALRAVIPSEGDCWAARRTAWAALFGSFSSRRAAETKLYNLLLHWFYHTYRIVPPNRLKESAISDLRFTDAQAKLKADAGWRVAKYAKLMLNSILQFNGCNHKALFKQLIACKF